MKPYLFQLPDWLPVAAGRPIFSYGVMLGVSFIIGWSLCVHLCRKDGMDAKVASTGMFVIVLSSLMGARLFHFLADTSAKPLTFANFFKFDEGGLVAYGGILGGLIGIFTYMRVKKYDGWAYWDNAAPGVALGLGITRIGCFLFGCDYGIASTSKWAVRFPRWEDPDVIGWIKGSAPAYTAHYSVPTNGGMHLPYDSVALFSHSVHPSQLYESLVGFAGFALCLLWHPAKRFHGQVMLVFMGYYAVARFLLERLRGDADRGDDVAAGLSTSQLTSLLILAAAAILWWWQGRKGLYALPTGALEPAFAPAAKLPSGRRGGRKRR